MKKFTVLIGVVALLLVATNTALAESVGPPFMTEKQARAYIGDHHFHIISRWVGRDGQTRACLYHESKKSGIDVICVIFQRPVGGKLFL